MTYTVSSGTLNPTQLNPAQLVTYLSTGHYATKLQGQAILVELMLLILLFCCTLMCHHCRPCRMMIPCTECSRPSSILQCYHAYGTFY